MIVSKRLTPWALSAGGYVTLTVVFTGSLVFHLSSVLPHDLGDPVLATWILWWNAHVTPLTDRWWNAPYFWPSTGITTFSEHLLGISLLTTPLMWLGASAVAAYNVAFLVSFPLSAIGAHALGFRLTRRHDAGVIAGLIYGFNPYRTAQISHLQVIWSFLMPLALLTLHAYREDGRPRWLGLLTAAILLQGMGNGYYLVYFPVLIALWVLWFVDLRREFQRVASIGAAGVAALACALPILIQYLRVHAAFGFVRHIGEIRFFSADLASLTWTSPEVAAWVWRSHHTLPEQQLFFGLTALLLVGVTATTAAVRLKPAPSPWPRARMACMLLATLFLSLGVGTFIVGPWRIAAGSLMLATLANFSKPFGIGLACAAVCVLTGPRFLHVMRSRSAFGFYVFASVALFILAMGPNPAFGQVPFFYRAPYAWLVPLPGFSAIRAPARFGMLIALTLSAAAALAFARLASRVSEGFGRRAAAVIVAGILADSWVHGLVLAPVPDRVPLAEKLAITTPIVELPLGDSARDLEAMYRAMFHQHPLLNGYGGYVPAYYPALRFGLMTPREAGLAAFSGIGSAITVVVDARTADGRRWAALLAAVPGAVDLGADAGRRLFTVPDDRARFKPLDGPRLPIRAMTANGGSVDLALVTDGNRLTGWRSGAPQRGDEVIAIDLGESRRLNGFTMSLGQYTDDFPRALAIDTSEDGRTWVPRTSPVLGQAVAAARLDPLMVPIPIALRRVPARYLRLRQLGQDPLAEWSFAELAVYGN